MRRLRLPASFAALVLALGLSLCPLAGYAQEGVGSAPAPAKATTADLIEGAKAWDGKTVLFEGEAIGDLMRRGDHVWVNVLDSNAALGVWMTQAQADLITHLGSYSMSGDRLRVTGVFHRACAEHGGDLDLHATTVELLAAGEAKKHPVSDLELWLLIPAFATAACLYLAWRRREATVLKARRQS